MYIKRDREKELNEWYEQRDIVLEVSGMRQVGKTEMITNFLSTGIKHKIITMMDPEYLKLFEDNIINIDNYKEILEIDQDTILFIDEIQKSTNAYNFIKVYKDRMIALKQDVNLIVSGSYVDVTITINKGFMIPLGCTKRIVLYPINFREFVLANDGGIKYIKVIEEYIKQKKRIVDGTHRRMIELFDIYMQIGGYPSIVVKYLSMKKKGIELSNILIEVSEYLNNQIDKQKLDIQRNHLSEKEHSKSYKKNILNLYESIKKSYINAHNIEGEKLSTFKYVYINDNKPHKEKYETVLQHLTQGNIITLVERSDTKGFKLFYSDIAVANKMIAKTNSNKLGSMYEQFVGQEILSYNNDINKLKYWYEYKDGRGHEIEVMYKDFLIDVKSSRSGHATNSLDYYVKKYKNKDKVLVLHYNNINNEGKYLKIPVYAVWALKYL